MSSSLSLLYRSGARLASRVRASAFVQAGTSRLTTGSIHLRALATTKLTFRKPLPTQSHLQGRRTKSLTREADYASRRAFSTATRKNIPNAYPGSPRGRGPHYSKPVIQQVNFIPEKQRNTVYALGIVVGIGFTYYVLHLEQVPETGRWRFMDKSVIRWEKRAVQSELEEIKSEYKGHILPPNHPVTRQVRGIVQAILDANNLGVVKSETGSMRSFSAFPGMFGGEDTWDPDSGAIDVRPEDGTHLESNTREWELIVVDDKKTVNAAALPGAIIVFTGILPVAQDVQGLAAVLGHEIAHVVARHTSEKIALTTYLRVALFALVFFGVDINVADWVTHFLINLPNSRTVELEADKIGLQLAARACFDPRAAPEMQERLMNATSGRALNVSFLQTHPSGKQRVQRLVDALPEAYAIRASSGACGQLQDDYDAFRETADRLRSEQRRFLRL